MRALAFAALALLAACSAEREPEKSAPIATPPVQSAQPRTMIAADFVTAELGSRVAGMEIVDAPLGGARKPFARATAYVACQQDVAQCDPAVLPDGTRYTYVLTITPEPPKPPPSTPGATPPPVPLAIPVAGLLATIAPVPGFDGAVGYSLAQAAAALGAEDAIAVTLEQGRIVWRVRDGSRWAAGKPVTVWWRSTQPPVGTKTEAYEVAVGTKNISFAAPFPDTSPDRD